MASSLNRVTLIGRLGADPEIRELSEGRSVATLSVVTSDIWADTESGKPRERVEWNRVVVLSAPLIEVAESLHKGSRIYVEGSLRTRKWVDKKNIERYSTEIVLRPLNGMLTPWDAPAPVTAPAPTPRRIRPVKLSSPRPDR